MVKLADSSHGLPAVCAPHLGLVIHPPVSPPNLVFHASLSRTHRTRAPVPRLVSLPKHPIVFVVISKQLSPPLGLRLIHQGNPSLDFLILSLSYSEKFLNEFCVFWMLLVSVRALKFRGTCIPPIPAPHSHPTLLPQLAQEKRYREPQVAPILAHSVYLDFLFLLWPPGLLIPCHSCFWPFGDS